jgi:hypothetical protein
MTTRSILWEGGSGVPFALRDRNSNSTRSTKISYPPANRRLITSPCERCKIWPGRAGWLWRCAEGTTYQRVRSFRGRNQTFSDSIARTISRGSARSRLAKSCFMCSLLDVPVNGSIPTMRAKLNTTWAGVAFRLAAQPAIRGC